MICVTVYGSEGGHYYFGDILDARAFAATRREFGYRVKVRAIGPRLVAE